MVFASARSNFLFLQRSEQLDEMARVAQEDFARHADDETMNKYMKEVYMFGSSNTTISKNLCS